jgi:HK97 family phage prohead protease
MDKTEKRSGYTRTQFVTEAKPEEKALAIRGYAILFDEPTEVYDKRNGLYTEVIKREALENADLSDVYLLFGHDYNQVLGHTRANLRLEVDDVGLFYEVELPNTRLSRDVFNLVETKNYLNREVGGSIVDGNSFGFYTNDEVIDGVRVVKSLYLDEISIVPRPAYLNACSIAVRNADKVEHQQSNTDNENADVEHQQDEEALKERQEALKEKFNKLEDL